MELSKLSPVAGSTQVGKRKGRGPGSGNGKTAGRGHKGLYARSGGKVLMKPAPEGTGVIAGGAVRAVMEAVGIKNITARCLRSNNPQNVVKAAMVGLTSLRSPEQVAAIRGKSVEEII